MDLLSHTCSGLAVGLTLINLTEGSTWQKTLIVLASGLGGALPDLDAISLWSQFDRIFNLPISGREIYSGKYALLHHGAMHSLLLSILFGSAFFLPTWIRSKKWIFNKKALLKSMGFTMGYNLHLLKDMPTPAATWGGVRYFFPAQEYIGGAGKIWWWNNYDLFLIILSVIVFQLLLFLVRSKWRRRIAPLLFIIGVSLFTYQINHRKYHYAYRGHAQNYQQYEEWSKLEQREILGEKIFNIMESFDHSIPLYF